MYFEDYGIPKKQINILEKRGITSVEDLQMLFPRKYYDFTKYTTLLESNNDKDVVIKGVFSKIDIDKKNNTLMLKAKVDDPVTGKRLHIIWIGSYFLKNIIKEWLGETVTVCGHLKYENTYNTFHMANPMVFEPSEWFSPCIHTVYTKIKGISDEALEKSIRMAISAGIEEDIPEDIRNKRHLITKEAAVKALHNPQKISDIKPATQRIIYGRLLEFSCDVEKRNRIVSKGTLFNIKSCKSVDPFIKSLPYELTKSQLDVFNDMKHNAEEGIRINALIEGDVGSGKTVSAFLIMLAMADSGYQSMLVAPTIILATQHYEKLKRIATDYGYKTAFLGGKQTVKEKNKIVEGIKNGDYNFIVGTQAVFSDNIEYKSLALAIVDEEHKFGVMQRRKLTDRAKFGVHYISMSATPIPRTLAEIIYGSNITVYSLEIPGGRKPIQTAIVKYDKTIFDFITKKIVNDHQQVYVVCPFITENENMADILSVEKTTEMYKKYFKNMPSIRIASISGNMDQEKISETISEFAKGDYDILISTTIIEVGVNVPNANIMVVNNAERFGVSQLHQLRGRVGRGKDQGYCILKSDMETDKLNILTQTNDGAVIAEKDKEQRGMGDILGTEQSGKNEYLELVEKYPQMYTVSKEDAIYCVEHY